MAKPEPTGELEMDRRYAFRDALQMAINDFASALQHAYAISGRGDHTTTAHQRNTYWLPQEPTDTHIVSGYNVPRDVKVHVPERCGYYCVELVFSRNAEVAEMLKAKSNSLRAGEPLHYSKEELRHLSNLHFSLGSIWRPSDIDRVREPDSHHIRLTFPGTREALDAILPRLQATVDGETLEFTVSDLAHVSFVEHNNLYGSPILTKSFYRDFDMQQPHYEYDAYDFSAEYWQNLIYSGEEQHGYISWYSRHYCEKDMMEQDAVYFSLKFSHLQQQQSKELVDNYIWLEQERIIHTLSSSQRTVRPSIAQGGSVFLRPVESYLEAATEEHESSSSEEWSDAPEFQSTSVPSQTDDGGEALADSEDTTKSHC